jgi:5,10-methylene-tetrahydrofolate dehydrogenase/methenyl tetrahydrofolate cyclohydrolase
MGDTKYFHIFDLFENSESIFIGERKNTVRNMDHANTGKMKTIIAVVRDADILVARKKSPNFVKIAKFTEYQPVIVSAVSISDIQEELHQAFGDIYSLVQKRKSGETFDTVFTTGNQR